MLDGWRALVCNIAARSKRTKVREKIYTRNQKKYWEYKKRVHPHLAVRSRRAYAGGTRVVAVAVPRVLACVGASPVRHELHTWRQDTTTTQNKRESRFIRTSATASAKTRSKHTAGGQKQKRIAQIDEAVRDSISTNIAHRLQQSVKSAQGGNKSKEKVDEYHGAAASTNLLSSQHEEHTSPLLVLPFQPQQKTPQ